MRLFFRLSQFEKEKEARDLTLARAAVALGRKVLADSPRPDTPPVARDIPKRLSPREANDGRMRMSVESRIKVSLERRQLECRHLSMANTHIAKGEGVIWGQIATIEKLRCDGHDTRLAEDTLRVFAANLEVMREHRDLIIRTIEEN